MNIYCYSWCWADGGTDPDQSVAAVLTLASSSWVVQGQVVGVAEQFRGAVPSVAASSNSHGSTAKERKKMTGFKFDFV